MELPPEENLDVSALDSLLNDNWNERKHLAETEFELRHEIQSLLQSGDSLEKFEEAKARERASRVSLTRNNDQYDTLIDKWAASVFKDKV